MAQLPHGRGIRRGADPRINQAESWASRSRELVPANEWVFPGFPYALDGPTTLVTYSQNVVFGFLPHVTTALEAAYARVRVTTAQAGQHVRAALYRVEGSGSKKQFSRVPGTDVTFDASTTGLKDTKLPISARLVPGEHYLLGFRSSHASVALPGLSPGSASLLPVYTLEGSATGDFPGGVNVLELTTDHSTNIPWIVYMANDLKDLI